MAAQQKKSDPTVIVVLLICVIMGMWQGARGLVEKASAGYDSSQIRVEGTDAERGTIRVASPACKDTPDALDTVRWSVKDSAGKEVARTENPVVAGRGSQTASLGNRLPADRYTITVTCHANQRQVGQSHSKTVVLGSTSQGWGGAKQGEPAQPSRPGLPNTGA